VIIFIPKKISNAAQVILKMAPLTFDLKTFTARPVNILAKPAIRIKLAKQAPKPKDNVYNVAAKAVFEIRAISNNSATKGAQGVMPTINPKTKMLP
jgi:hypothetical protein